MILCKTPLRASFLGGGTDFPEFFLKHSGAVLGSAIDKYVYHSVMPFHSKLFDYSVRIAYRQVECVKSVDEIQHAPFREVLKAAGIQKDVEISLTSDLPSFSGLGSSSTFVVGMLNALMAFQGFAMPRLELAYKAIEIERHRLKDAVGCQDQLFAAVGGLNLVEFFAEDNIVVHRLPLSRERLNELQNSLLLFYTGIHRRASQIEAKKIDNIHNLTDYLLEMRRLVDEGHKALVGGGELSQLGRLLDRSWQLKRNLHGDVSTDTIDAMYHHAREAGALGGKILGAGGGGFMLLFVPPERQAKVRSALAGYYEIEFKLNAPGTQIVHA
ncbi:MAG: GHMP kinase [Phycisphaerae bacterium]|nr:GHMP kinase [Phycisphaerae bacterium]